MLNRFPLAVRVIMVALTAVTSQFVSATAEEPDEFHDATRSKEITAFLTTHCSECHAEGVAEGDFELSMLNVAGTAASRLKKWQLVLDRIEQGEMPPQDAEQPPVRQRETLVRDLTHKLVAADRRRQDEFGRGVIRRLNRSEFETALSDAIQLPLHIQEELPEDARSHGFDTVGSALNVSSVQIESYLTAIDKVIDQATTLYEQPQRRTHRLTYREENGIMQVYRKTGPFEIRKDGVAFFATEKFSHLNAVLSQWTAPHTGRYRVKVSAYAVRAKEPVILSLRAGGVGHSESNHVPHKFLDHFSLTEGKPVEYEWEGWLERGHYFHAYPTSLRPMRFAGPKEQMRQHEYQGPGAVVQWVEVDGPIIDQWPPASHRALWGETPMKANPDAERNEDPIVHLDRPPTRTAKPKLTQLDKPEKGSGNRWIYDPDQKTGGEPIHRAAPIPKPLLSTYSFASTMPKADAAKLLHRFANRVFRRPASEREVAPYVALTHRWLDDGRDFESAMRIGFKALLTSPGFLYHQGSLPDSESRLNQHALAERLAFFLWNGLPDDELRQLADAGKLADVKVLRSHVDRMLADEKSNRFLEQFLGLWLDLRLIDFTTPDEKLYPEFDQLLGWSMLQETRAFVRKLIDEDLPASNIVDSKFAMVNWRLAKHYRLPPMIGMQVKAIDLPADSVRGGIITQGSVLKVTANGTTTSPVVRGVWLLERIMGVRPDPPPSGIPAIEPDIRGAITVRQQLEKHRSSESCVSCHAKIDPPGVALESFDVIGGWRDHYRALNEELADLNPRFSSQGPPPIRYVQGLAVDASCQLADGDSFEDVEGFKALLLKHPRLIARGVTEKLTVYATGAEISLADKSEIKAILDRSATKEFGFRTLIHELVQSPLFHRK